MAAVTRLQVEMFNALDADHSGSLDETEAVQLARMLMPGMSEEHINGVLRQMDADESGTVELDELKQCGLLLLPCKSSHISHPWWYPSTAP